MNSLYQNQ